MDAIVSGQASVAIIADRGKYFAYYLDQKGPPQEVPDWKECYIFRDVNDVRYLYNTSIDAVKIELEAAWAEDRCLHMLLIILDAKIRASTRAHAAACAESMLGVSRTELFVANRLYAATLPIDSLVYDAVFHAEKLEYLNLSGFLRVLKKDQTEIGFREAAWNKLDISLFGSHEYKDKAKLKFRNAGAFRLFVQERHRGSTALLQLLADPSICSVKNYRSILTEWAKPFNEYVSGPSFGTVDALREGDRRYDVAKPPASRRAMVNGMDAFANVSKQKDKIKSLLKQGHREKARDFIDQLVISQGFSGTSEHRAKSLCDLAKYAGQLGDVQLELELCDWATKEATEDSWAWAQLGHAQRLACLFQDSLESYDKARMFGDERIALSGRAEVLRDSGLLDDTLEVYRVMKEKFPADPVPWTATASALADFGYFEDSLMAYEEAIKRFPDSEYSFSGKAQVLRDMGRLDESVRTLNASDLKFGEREVNNNIRAQIHREKYQFVEAGSLFRRIIDSNDNNIYAFNGLASTLREMGNFEEANNVYAIMKKRFVMDYHGFLGTASILKLKGDFIGALSAYSDALGRFPNLILARNGKASVLAAMEEYSEALSLLSDKPPQTVNDWTAYHIRGLIFLKRGDLDAAVHLFQAGVGRVPWAYQRRFFETSLSAALVRKELYLEARSILLSTPPPPLLPIHNILNLHISAALKEAYREVRGPQQLELKGVMKPIVDTRNILIGILSGQTSMDFAALEFVYETECNVILSVAA